MWTNDNEVVSQMIEEGLKKRKAEEDKARPVGTIRYRAISKFSGWLGDYDTRERAEAKARTAWNKDGFVEKERWNGKEWEEA